MLSNSKSTITVAMFFTALFVLMLAKIPAAAQCESVTDQKLVTDMYAKIKGDKNLASQIRRINVTSLNLVIKLQGYTNKKTDHDRLVGYALKMACVKMVNSNELAPVPPDSGTGGVNQRLAGGGCTSGTKQCGDICIPESDICNIESFLQSSYEPFRFMDMTALYGFGITATDSCVMN